MPEVKTERNGIIASIIVAEQYKNRIHVIGRIGQKGCELRPFESFLVIADEWTDGYEIDTNHNLAYDHPDAMSHDEWTEEIEFFVPMILWGSDQSYDDKISDEHRELVADLD